MLQCIYAASSRLSKATRRQLRRFFLPERMAALSAPMDLRRFFFFFSAEQSHSPLTFAASPSPLTPASSPFSASLSLASLLSPLDLSL
ncbi:unnamed protein product [Microthlaspi erraticum]|uniref:Uncharacterized protein n=1 Tax=Microthlaspi erraticum TaxID=1685480 RepID=A0A6D2IPA3_9BRAS|nr:unnamed protein product [Microthlaspi erraticum]